MNKSSLFMGPELLDIDVYGDLAHKYRVNDLKKHFKNLSDIDKQLFLDLLIEDNRQGMLDFYERVTGKALLYQESQTIEQKSSIWVASDGTPRGLEEKAFCLGGMTNSQIGGCLLIGIDKNMVFTGVENELLSKGISRELAEARIRNTLGQLSSHDYIRRCRFTWLSVALKPEKHLLLRIDAPSSYSDVVVVSGNKIPLRSGSTSRLLKGQEMINFVKEFYKS